MRKAFVRWFTVLAVACVLWVQSPALPAAHAQDLTAEPEIKYIAPQIASDAPVYDPAQPEALVEEQLYAKSAILIEASTGEVIFEKNADEMMYPASTTKILSGWFPAKCSSRGSE